MEIDIKKVTILEIGEDEVHLLTHYRMAYLTELQGERPVEYRERLKHDLDLYFKEALREQRCFAFMAKAGDVVLSFGAMIIKKIPGDFNKSLYLEGDILNMYTIPEARSRGISAMILSRLIDEAKRRGISKISLHTTKAGEKLYRKFGFKDPHYPVLELIIE